MAALNSDYALSASHKEVRRSLVPQFAQTVS
jgi:hypothetical protein